MKNRLHWLALLLVCIACSNNPSTPKQMTLDNLPVPKDKLLKNVTGVHGGKLVLATASNPKTFNSMMLETNEDQLMAGHMLRPLNDLDSHDFSDTLALAKNMEVSQDGLTYTFTLREGLYWSDGHPFGIDDVMFTFEVLYDPNVPASEREMFRNADGSMAEITQLNATQVQFKIKEINVLFKAAVGSILMLPKHKLEASFRAGTFTQSWSVKEDASQIVGLGPFVLDSYVPDQRVVFKRNPYYFAFDKNGQRLPYLDKIIYLIVPDVQTKTVKFQNNEVDMLADVKAEDMDMLKRDEVKGDYTVYDLGPSYNKVYLLFNQNTQTNKNGEHYLEEKKLKLFSDKRFKQAMAYAMDREGIVKTLLQGRGTPTYGFESPANKIWFDPNRKSYPFDLAKAKALLTEIGLKDSDGDGFLEYADGSKLTFTLKTNSENNTRVQIATLIRNDLNKLGIDAISQPIPFNSLNNNLNSDYDFDAAIVGWASAIPPDPVMSKSVLLSKGTSHQWNPNQPTPQTEWEKEIDALMIENQSTLDINVRKKSWNRMMEIWHEELPTIFLYSPNVNLAIRNHIGNLDPVQIRPYFTHNIEELYIKAPTQK